MDKNGKPFFKKWDVVILGECIICNLDTSMGLFMKFVKDIPKGRHIRIVACTKSGVEDWFITVGLVIYRLRRFVESSLKSCENLL